MQANLYNQKAENIGKVTLPDSVFAVPMNNDLLYQIVTSQISNKRQPVAHTKDRSEVKGGGKKPWRQKGTGRARHGSIRSPIWKGGGVTFGPRNDKSYKKGVNKKMARKALFVALSSKVKDNELIVLDGINLEKWKTKEMAAVINKISELFSKKYGNLLLVTDGKADKTIGRAANNLPKVDVVEAKDLNALNVMARKNMILIKDSLGVIEKNFHAKK